jgi:chorismate mutase/prephenate dehydratase
VKKEGRDKGEQQAMSGHREEIDQIDEQILALLLKRQGVAVEIGRLKRELGMDVLDQTREQKVLRRLTSKGQGNLNAETIRNIFSEIMSAARSVQQVPTVAYLGPEATFSHQAALYHYGRSATFRASRSIEDIFAAVEKGLSQQGVVPIENSTEGPVTTTMDLLFKYDLRISTEIYLRIRHHLLSKAEGVAQIKQLYSHPMPLAQCRTWIRNHLGGVPVEEVSSTAVAAKIAAEAPDAASIGSQLTSSTYGLHILEEGIEDIPDNFTRFLVIGKNRPEPSGQDKTSLLFLVSHKPGALHQALGSLASRDINMTRIESRPMKTRKWEYLFFVDVEGHEKDRNVGEALAEMEGHCVFVKRLGSYPAGGAPWD